MPIVRKEIFLDLTQESFKYVREGELASYPLFVHELAEKLAHHRDQICPSVFMSLSFYNAKKGEHLWAHPHTQTFKPKMLWPRKNSSKKTLRVNLNKLWDAKLTAIIHLYGIDPGTANLHRSVNYPARLKLSFSVDSPHEVAPRDPKPPKPPKTAWDHING